MKVKNILTYFIVLYLMVACNSAGNQKTAENAATEGEPAKMASILTDDACFEKKMEHWFLKFNQLQNEGKTMQEANDGAIAWVAVEFKTCADPVAISAQKQQ